MNYLTKLDGKKTWIVLVLAALSIGFEQLGYIEPEVYKLLLLIFGFAGIGTTRHAIKKLEK